ncbi:hypothetical protein RUM43_008749, partial [Polyplax serrata]
RERKLEIVHALVLNTKIQAPKSSCSGKTSYLWETYESIKLVDLCGAPMTP